MKAPLSEHLRFRGTTDVVSADDEAGLGYTVNEVASSTERISDMVAQMATATEEQSVTSEDVSRNVHGISAVSNGLAAGVAQIARSTNGLNDLADGLGELVASFTVSEDPAAAGASPQRSMLLGDGSSGKVPAFALSGRSEG